MVDDVLRLRGINFSMVKLPRYDYAEQTKISQERVDLATACPIHYELNTGMVVRYLKDEYVGESWNSKRILEKVSPYIDEVDCEHIKRIIHQGCPSHLDFKEEYDNKHMVLQKGNQLTFLQFPEVTTKAMNKEEKNSHVLSSISRVACSFFSLLPSNTARHSGKIWQASSHIRLVDTNLSSRDRAQSRDLHGS